MTLMPALTGGLLFCLSNFIPMTSKWKVCGGNLMCYGDPVELLKKVIDGRTLHTNAAGHTVIDDFEHFCSYTGWTLATPGQSFAFVRCSVTNP